MTPRNLNGYPVLHREDHRNGYFTVMVERAETDFVVATWWPDLGSTWSWGHYLGDQNEATGVFKEVATRNRQRSAVAA